MSTGYGWEGLRQVCVTPLSACHVPERLCAGLVCLGRYNKCSPLPFFKHILLLQNSLECCHCGCRLPQPGQLTIEEELLGYHNNNN